MTNTTTYLKTKQGKALITAGVVIGAGVLAYYLFFRKKGLLETGKKTDYTLEYVQQGKINGEIVPTKTALTIVGGTRPPKDKHDIKDMKVKISDSKNSKGGIDIDGVYDVTHRWVDSAGNLGAVWVDINKKLGKSDVPGEVNKDFKGTKITLIEPSK